MSGLNLVVSNAQWMNDLFGPNYEPAAFRPDDEEPGHSSGTTIRQRRDDLSGVLNELGPDLVVITEGPNSRSELQLFFDEDVDGIWETTVQPT